MMLTISFVLFLSDEVEVRIFRRVQNSEVKNLNKLVSYKSDERDTGLNQVWKYEKNQ